MAKGLTVSQRKIAGVPVVLTYPKTPKAITFILTAANLAIDNYDSIKNTLVEMGHLVVGFYINVLVPPWKNHRNKAQKTKDIFEELKSEFGIKNYSIIGHSIGGKIALLVTALHNGDETLCNVLALDPVDSLPAEFTSSKNNLSISRNYPYVYVTCTENAQPLVDDNHNGKCIQQKNRKVKLISHKGAGHLAYCDGDVGSLSWANSLPKGNGLKDKAVLEETLEFIRQNFYSDIILQTGAVIKNSASTFAAPLKNAKAGLNDLGNQVAGMFNKPIL
jgi:hypothetical protein